MVRAWVLIIVLMLFLPNVFAAIDQAAPNQNIEDQIQALLAQQGEFLGTYAVTAADLEKARTDLISDYRSYSDE
jgi:hypothetical protein